MATVSLFAFSTSIVSLASVSAVLFFSFTNRKPGREHFSHNAFTCERSRRVLPHLRPAPIKHFVCGKIQPQLHFNRKISFPVWHLRIQGAFTKSVRVYPCSPGRRDELGLSNCMARVPRSPERGANPQQGGQVPNNRASHLRIWLRRAYCVYNIRRWAAGAAADGVNEWVDLRALWNPGAGFRLKSVWNSIGKVEPWPGCACVTGGRGSLEDLVSDEYFTASRERSIRFHSPAIDTRTPQISQIRASSKQITLHSQVTLSESLDLIKWAPGMRSCVSSDQPYH